MAITVNSGDLKHRALFKEPTTVQNSEGGLENIAYTTEISTLAFVRDSRQARVTEGDATALLHTKECYIRWSTGRTAITKDWLVEIKGVDYFIHEIEDINLRERFLRFTIKAKQ